LTKKSFALANKATGNKIESLFYEFHPGSNVVKGDTTFCHSLIGENGVFCNAVNHSTNSIIGFFAHLEEKVAASYEKHFKRLIQGEDCKVAKVTSSEANKELHELGDRVKNAPITGVLAR